MILFGLLDLIQLYVCEICELRNRKLKINKIYLKISYVPKSDLATKISF